MSIPGGVAPEVQRDIIRLYASPPGGAYGVGHVDQLFMAEGRYPTGPALSVCSARYSHTRSVNCSSVSPGWRIPFMKVPTWRPR